MLQVSDLNHSIEFYEKAFSMELLHTRDNPELKRTEKLTDNYVVTEYDKGNGYAKVLMMCTGLLKLLNLLEERLPKNLDHYPASTQK
ncbi:hypothetical protein K1719_000186 [Acacia pycnantha]|nr:hypothetical protein K1719_000186 [Acacia pycnantha]